MSTAHHDTLKNLTETGDGRERLAAAHRYTQVGMCVSSVTHDINNHLGAVMAYAELLGMDHADPETTHMVTEIIEAVKRSSDLIDDLTAIARKERPETTPALTTDIARRALDIRSYDLRIAQVTVEEKLPPEGRLLHCDRPRMEQCLLYLISNSLEALAGCEKPTLRFTLTHEDDQACFEVWDSGPGIPEDHRERCFEPLVTTKESPHLGLGLFTARRVADMHGGALSYDAERGMRLCVPLRNPAFQSGD